MREQDLQNLVIQTARAHGVLAYHAFDSRRSEPGFPDVVLLGRQGVIYRELKTETGKLSPEQKQWIAALTDAGEDAGVWRPSDWPNLIEPAIRALGRVRIHKPTPSQVALRKHLQRKGLGPQS